MRSPNCHEPTPTRQDEMKHYTVYTDTNFLVTGGVDKAYIDSIISTMSTQDLSSSGRDPSTKRETFDPAELAVCLSHYDLGIIHSIQPFTKGSRRSPKVIINCERGKFLFKRRAHGKNDVNKVAFTHQIQLYLAGQGFPLPHLIGTRKDNNSMLILDGRIYELFEFIEGKPYDRSLSATLDAGRILGLFHKLMLGFHGDYEPPSGSYHGSNAVRQAVHTTVGSLPPENKPSKEILTETTSFLDDAYLRCATEADENGLRDWPKQIVHGDWHPGNMLFRNDLVAAVIDYDTARLQQRIIDLANGAVQFSIIGGSQDPNEWPDYPDKTRLKRFLLGYDSVNVISKAEIKILPLLMCEAMIAEAVLPIAATGSFGSMEGFPFLQMIQRKVKWILDHVEEVRSILKD